MRREMQRDSQRVLHEAEQAVAEIIAHDAALHQYAAATR